MPKRRKNTAKPVPKPAAHVEEEVETPEAVEQVVMPTKSRKNTKAAAAAAAAAAEEEVEDGDAPPSRYTKGGKAKRQAGEDEVEEEVEEDVEPDIDVAQAEGAAQNLLPMPVDGAVVTDDGEDSSEDDDAAGDQMSEEEVKEDTETVAKAKAARRTKLYAATGLGTNQPIAAEAPVAPARAIRASMAANVQATPTRKPERRPKPAQDIKPVPRRSLSKKAESPSSSSSSSEEEEEEESLSDSPVPPPPSSKKRRQTVAESAKRKSTTKAPVEAFSRSITPGPRTATATKHHSRRNSSGTSDKLNKIRDQVNTATQRQYTQQPAHEVEEEKEVEQQEVPRSSKKRTQTSLKDSSVPDRRSTQLTQNQVVGPVGWRGSTTTKVGGRSTGRADGVALPQLATGSTRKERSLQQKASAQGEVYGTGIPAGMGGGVRSGGGVSIKGSSRFSTLGTSKVRPITTEQPEKRSGTFRVKGGDESGSDDDESGSDDSDNSSTSFSDDDEDDEMPGDPAARLENIAGLGFTKSHAYPASALASRSVHDRIQSSMSQSKVRGPLRVPGYI